MNSIMVVASYIIIAIPMLFGFIKWKDLPEKMAIHFAVNGKPNGYAPKLVPVVLIPILLAVVQTIVFISFMNEGSEIDRFVLLLGLWLIPIVSTIVSVSIYRFALK